MLVLCTNFIWFWVTRHPRWFAGCPPLNGWYWTNKNMVNNSFWNVGHSWLPTSCAWKVGKDFPPCKRNSNKPLNDGSRWWQLKDFLGLFTPIFWEDDPIWRSHIFQMGWFNHQGVVVGRQPFLFLLENGISFVNIFVEMLHHLTITPVF